MTGRAAFLQAVNPLAALPSLQCGFQEPLGFSILVNWKREKSLEM